MDRMRNVDGHIGRAEDPRRDAMEFKWDTNTCSYCGDGHRYHLVNQDRRNLQPPGNYAVFIENDTGRYDLMIQNLPLAQAKQWCEMHHAVGADND